MVLFSAVQVCNKLHLSPQSPGRGVAAGRPHYMLGGGGIQTEMGVTRSQMRRSPWRPRRTCWQQTGIDARASCAYGRQSALVAHAPPGEQSTHRASVDSRLRPTARCIGATTDRLPGTRSRILSGIQRAAQTVSGVRLKRTCSPSRI